MRPALLLVDLQNDFLADTLTTPAGELIRRASALLEGCRADAVPVVHVWTTVSRGVDDRMPHWRRAGRWRCVEGSDGHRTPAPLRPRAEAVVHKTFFSAFSAPQLDVTLGELGADTLIVAGVQVHGCVRATVLDGYERGFTLWVAEDAVASGEPLHAAVTRRYLETRAATFAEVDAVLDRVRADATDRERPERPSRMERSERVRWIEGRSPRRRDERLWRLPVASPAEVSEAAAVAAGTAREWRRTVPEERAELLERMATLVTAGAGALAEQIARELGTPLHYSGAEIERAAALLRAAARPPSGPEPHTAEAELRRAPLGLIAVVTPWNNVGIPLGKLAPALYYGNGVIWKPAPAASGIAATVAELLREAGCPPHLVTLLHGGAETATALMADPAVAAVTLTGSSRAGYAAQATCGERRIPLQAELGGNNAAIVWHDCDLPAAASAIAEAGFGAAGQRCTANARVIVDEACYDAFVVELERATDALKLGDPLDPSVRVGPLVADAARRRVSAAVDRARSYAEVLEPCAGREPPGVMDEGAYLAPVLIACEDPSAEIVQEETFGPVVVIQRASSFERALELQNGVAQGLVASLFSTSAERRTRFADVAQAGILKLGRATAGAGVEAPFGGWKSSGVGPPEHGAANREFYTRPQAVYS